MKQNNRENNYDLLRIISAAAVVFIHINQHYMAYPEPKDSVTGLIETVIEVFTRFCVPCFLMLSGAFVLSNPKNKEYKPFYKSRFKKIILPYFVVNAVFFAYDLVFTVIEGGSFTELSEKYVTGYAYNLWFIPVIAGLYLLTPAIIRFKESVSARTFGIVSGLWIVFAVIFQTTSTYVFAFSFTSVFSYLGYYLAGCWIYENLCDRLNPVPFALIALTMYSLRVFLKMNDLTWIFRNKNVYFYPTIVIAAIAVFILFSNVQVSAPFGAFASASLYVYLLHTFLFDLILRFTGDKIIVNELLTDFILTAVCFSVPLIIGLLITKRKKLCIK